MVKRDLIRNIVLLILTIIAVICIRIFWITPYHVSEKEATSSLAKNDLVLAVKNDSLVRGKQVLYTVNGKERVGRIIAKPGDRVIYMDDVLYLNGKIQEEPYLKDVRDRFFAKPENLGNYFTHDFEVSQLPGTTKETVPQNKYLILNDNRQDVDDSRSVGLIQADQIQGSLDFRVTPLKKFGFVEK